ncbi:uncharacterized protein LOC117587335 isoform X2 [Drosophila guanche]|uniref:uncharacterized protein LOC117587335 isoform X2 n=1 Tax=Drosophila guanche TaxID=7266 RepID=UPI00147144B5|nr:uncharacterized protein LOC117587335 isoform X2 [Drosophila guanche]
MPSIANSSNGSSSNFLTVNDARLSYVVNQVASSTASASGSGSATAFPTFSPPRIESLVASSAEQDLSSFGDVTFDIFDDDDDLFGSPMAFDATEQGLWNGRFVPPPPRPPFFVDEPVLSDGLTTCDLCSWAMPTKNTFMFEGTIEKATELGWPLTLIIVSMLSALLGAIIMIAVVRCRRKKSSNNRNDTHVQWWSRNKRAHGNGLNGAGGGSGAGASAGSSAHLHHHPHNGSNNNISNNNNHLRRSNIYTAHPADSIRCPLPLPPSTSSPTLGGTVMAMTMSPSSSSTAAAAAAAAAGANGVAATAPPGQHYFHPYHQQHHPHAHAQHSQHPQHLHHQLQLQHQHQLHSHAHHPHHQQQQQSQSHQHVPLYPHDCDEDAAYEEPEYHQPQQLHSAHSCSSISSASLSVSAPSSPVPTEASSSARLAAAAAIAACQWPQASASTMVIAS